MNIVIENQSNMDVAGGIPMTFFENKHFTDNEVHVKEINKREIGKIILRFCGNEGCSNDPKTASMRRLLQHLIDHYQMEHQSVWQNAHVTIFDADSNSLIIQSGTGKHRFLVMLGMKEEPTIQKIKEKQCVIS